MVKLKNINGLLIKQTVELWEVFTPIETRNRFEIYDLDGNQILYGYELPGKHWYSWIVRSLLVAHRPFQFRVIDKDNNTLIDLHKRFRFYFHAIDVYQNGTELIGTVTRKFSILHKRFEVCDINNQVLCEIRGPIWRPWTFNIVQDGNVYGAIRKKWSGALKEIFGDADHFGIEFPNDASETAKLLLLAAVFLVDVVYFEGNEGLHWFPGLGD